MALGSLLCCGTNPFRKRKKVKGKNTAPYAQSKAKLSDKMDQPSANSPIDSIIQPNTVPSVKSVPPVQVETPAPHNDVRYTAAVETHGEDFEDVISCIQNPVCINPVVVSDETVTLESVKEYSPTVIQDDLDHQKAPQTIENQSPAEKFQVEQNLNDNLEGEIRFLNGHNLSSSRENIRGADEESLNPVSEEPDAVDSSCNGEGAPVRYIGQGELGIPEYQIEETEPQLYNGVLVPQVLIPSDLPIFEDEYTSETSLVVPSTMSGIIIGKQGKNVTELKERFQADISISPCDEDHSRIRLSVKCPRQHMDEVVCWILRRIRSKPSMTTIGNPYQLLRTLPLGELTRVFVRSSFSRKHMFVTIIDECYNKFLEMEKEMTADYLGMIQTRLQLYDPVVVGTIALLKTGSVYSRIIIMDIVDSTPKLAICFLLDHGTFCVAPISDLRKIKTRYMMIPFQAVSVMWAHAQSPYLDISDDNFLMRYFESANLYVYPVRKETCCRFDVVFLNKLTDARLGSDPIYQDILVQAANDGLCRIAGKVVNLEEQFELNRTDTAYYFWPHSSVYENMVFFRTPDNRIVSANENPLPRPQLRSQQQHQQDQLVNMQKQQRQGANQKQFNNHHPHPQNGGRGRTGPKRALNNNGKHA